MPMPDFVLFYLFEIRSLYVSLVGLEPSIYKAGLELIEILLFLPPECGD